MAWTVGAAATSAPPVAEPQLTELVYELLDAHADTVRLAAAQAGDPAWDLHARYLRDLQRTARELLAAATDAPSPRG